MDERSGRLLAQIITTIGTPLFVEATSHAIRAYSDFELSSVILHRADTTPQLLFEDLAGVGYGTGIENYIRFTYRANPILTNEDVAEGTYRARDFRRGQGDLRSDLQRYLVDAPDEELGFRTVGWPPHLEELGLYFGACGGIVEFSVYRERCRRSAPERVLQFLDTMRIPLAAAFERHAALAGMGHRTGEHIFLRLSAREGEVARLLLAGCSSEAISLRLGISRYTVKDHRKEIFRKLQIGSLAELFALASSNA